MLTQDNGYKSLYVDCYTGDTKNMLVTVLITLLLIFKVDSFGHLL